MVGLKGRDVLSLAELSEDEIIKILDLADRFKAERRKCVFRNILLNRTLAMIFQKPSTRTRVSFEVAVKELGGSAVVLSLDEIQLSRGESVKDTAKTLSRYVDAVMARVYSHSDVVELAEASDAPVINGLSDLYHPSQILADLQTIREVKGRLKGLKLAWVGDGNNVCNTFLIACSRTGINISVATPSRYRPYRGALETALSESEKHGCTIELTEDPEVAVRDADVVVTDTFVSMGSDQEREERLKVFLPRYRVNGELMRKAKQDAIFMHCLPAHRGEEVTDEVLDGPQSVVWDETENRLHTAKALLSLLLVDEAYLS